MNNPPNQPMTDELDEIIDNLKITLKFAYGVSISEHELQHHKQAIQALIDRECTKARIEALSSLLENEDGCICQLADQKVCDHNWSLCNTVREKIAELSNKENK